MAKTEFLQKDLTRKTLAGILVLSCFLFMGLKIKLDGITRKKVPGSSIIYIPSGKYLKYATFGFSAIAADLIYLWAIQYYSTYEIADRFNYLDHIFSIINELDPRFEDPYEVGAAIASTEANDPKTCYKILDRGLENIPEYWYFALFAGDVARTRKDFETAKKYYEKGMNIKGAPAFLKRFYADAIYKSDDLKTALALWIHIYNESTDPQAKKIASNHLYRVKATIDTRALLDAVAKFKEKRGRNPRKLEDLVKAGILEAIPKDLDGKDYLYNPETGQVTTAVIPWKR